MDDASRPANLTEFLAERLRELPDAARLVVAFDPGGRLELEAELTLERRKWRVIRYNGNDLAFRRDFQLDARVLVWVTGSTRPNETEPLLIDLSSLTDVIRKADDILDLSLTGVLAALIPGETWPIAPVERHAEILAARLDILVDAHTALRPHIEKGMALDAHSIRAMALHCLKSAIPPKEFLFKVDTPARVLSQYLTLAWAADWDDAGRELLRQQAREASRLPLGGLAAWFEVPTESLAQFLYLYRFLSRARVANVVNQVRGLGLLGFDPEPLEPGMSTALSLWARDAIWRQRVIQQAESNLELRDIGRALSLLDLSTPDRAAETMALAEAPALIYFLGARLLETASHAGQMPEALAGWLQHRPATLNSLNEGDARFARAALAMAAILDEAAFIAPRLADEVEPTLDLTGLLDWYVKGGYYDLEFAHARATTALHRLPDESLREFFQAYLDRLRKQMRAYLDGADHELARRIVLDWNGYLNHPRLSTRVLSDFVKAARLRPTADACLWFIVFDGMRYDTWERVVKPRLMQAYEVKKEKAYLCVLPSWTRIARTSLIAGRTPDAWRGHRKTFTYDQAALAARFFDLGENEQDSNLRFYSGMESDRVARRLDPKKRYPYNILIFNISDDDLHKQREHVGALNENVMSAVNRILDSFEGLIRSEDTVIVSSDHGFMELDPEDAILVRDDDRWQRYMEGIDNPVRYRYIIGVERPEGLPDEHAYSFEYRQMKDGKFTVPVGRRWFRREGAPNADRYAHGGLSFAEMVVTGAVLQLIVEKKIDLTFDGLPERLEATEGVDLQVGIWLRNRGNQPGEFELTYAADTDPAPQVARGTVPPGSRYEVPVTVKPVIRQGERKTEFLRLSLKFTTVAGKPKTVSREIPVRLEERKDVVEISFGGLDDLDR